MKTTDTSISRRSRRLTLHLTILIAVLCGISAPPTPTVKAQSIGEIGILKNENVARESGEYDLVMVATSRESLSKIYDALGSGDHYGLGEMAMKGELFVVPKGTHVRVIGSHGWLGGCLEVRILEGEETGKRGFVSIAAVEAAK